MLPIIPNNKTFNVIIKKMKIKTKHLIKLNFSSTFSAVFRKVENNNNYAFVTLSEFLFYSIMANRRNKTWWNWFIIIINETTNSYIPTYCLVPNVMFLITLAQSQKLIHRELEFLSYYSLYMDYQSTILEFFLLWFII